MAAVQSSTLSLRGAPGGAVDAKDDDDSIQKRRAILLHLNDQVVKDLQQCCQQGKVVQLLGGVSPKIRYGTKTLDLNVKPDTFRHEIYSANKDSGADMMDFSALVAHQAHVKTTLPKAEDSNAGEDAALAALKQSLASMAKEKEAKKATISSSVIPNKNGRMYSQRQPNSLLGRPSTTSSVNSTPRHGAAPTSAPSMESHDRSPQEKGMRIALIHLLAIKPTTLQDMHNQTRIPKPYLSALLSRVAESSGFHWELSSRTYKELNPWDFKYQTQDLRQIVIDHAVRAFDRIRVPREDKAWQMLLPKEKRGKGIVISRLLAVERRGDQSATPRVGQTPIQNPVDKLESHATPSSINNVSTPRNGGVATGRSAAGISIEKRLKDAKKKQDQEKKKREREIAASDRETKPGVTKPRPITAKRIPAKKISEKVKSAEIVHDSDDEEGEITDSKPARKMDTPIASSQRTTAKPKPTPSSEKRNVDVKRSVPVESKSKFSQPSKLPLDAKKASEGTPTKKAGPSTITAPTSKAKSTAASKQMSSERLVKSSQSVVPSKERQVSPKKDTRPKIPSPLGTVKPRTASEEAENRIKNSQPTKSLKSVATKTTASKSTSGELAGKSGPAIKKRSLEQMESGSEPPRKIGATKAPAKDPVKTSTTSTASARLKLDGNGKQSANAVSSSSLNTDAKLKRKANDMSSGLHDHEVPASKHRKTDSSSTHSHDLSNSSLTSLTTAPTASPDPASPRSPCQRTSPSSDSMDVIQRFLNDSEASPKTKADWETVLDSAVKFRDQLYPAYMKLYDRLESMKDKVTEEERRTLFMMHMKLKALKKDIYDASQERDYAMQQYMPRAAGSRGVNA